jgi:hypothetical protein
MTFRVKDGLSVNGALFVDTSTNVRAVSAVITGTTGVTSAVTGALQVAGGVGVTGGGFFGGTVTATTFVGAFAGAISGTATSANNLTNGTAGQVPYQTGAGATSFYGPGTAGQILVSAGTSAPTYTNTASIYVGNAAVANILNAGNTATQYVGFANKSNNIIAGTAGQLVYQSAADTTGFVGPGTAGQILVSAGTSAPVYTNTSSIYVNRAISADSASAVANALTAGTGLTSSGGTFNGSAAVTFSLNTATYMLAAVTAVTANNVAGGTAGQLVYQTGAGATSFAGPGTAGQLLMSAGTSAPSYTNTASIYVNSSVFAEDVRGGTAGAIVYQSAADTTTFLSLSGTAKSLLTAGASAPTYVTQVQAQSGTGSATQATGQSLVVTGGGLGVTGDSYFANSVGIANALTVGGTVTFNSNVVFNGTATTIASTNTIYTDNLISLHVPPLPATTWTFDDLKDIGFKFHHYKNGSDDHAALVLANDTKYLEWYGDGEESTTGTIWNGVYGTFKTGAVLLDNTTGATSAVTGALQVKGGVGVAGGIFAGGVVTATTFVGALTGNVSGSAGSVANALTIGSGLGGTSYNGSSAVTISLTTSTLMQTAVTAITANKVANAHTAGTGLTGTAFDGSAAQTWTLNTATLMQTAVTALSASGSAGSVANALTAGTGLTSSNGTFNGSAAVTFSLNTATYMDSARLATTANKVANAHTAGTGLTGTAFDGSAAQTWTLNTATLMAEAVSARSVSGANVSGNITGNAANVTGVVAIANGGSGQTTAQLAINAFAGAVTSAQYLRGNGTNVVMSAIQASDVPTLNQNTTGSAGSVANALTIGSGLSGTSYNGSSAVTIALTTATLMTTAVNLAGGTAGQLHYQTGAGATAFAGPGTAGQLLMSAGTSAPTYTNTASIYVGRATVADSVSGGASVTGNLTVTGNLIVQGVTTTVDSTVTNIADPIITIGGGAGGTAPTSNDSKDRGIAFRWHNGTAAKVGFFGYDNSTGYLTFVPDATITNEVVSGSVGDIQATNFRGTLVGNISNALTIGTGLGGTSYNGSSAVTITNTGVTSNVAGTGISVSGATGAVTITNSGVTSIVAGTAISVSGATGAVTINNAGTINVTGTANQVLVNGGTGPANGNVTFTLPQSIATSSNVQFGSVGINTAPSQRLHVAGNTIITGNAVIGATTTTNKFEVVGTSGQLFSVSDTFTGTIFAASDISGIPSIEVLDTGLVKLAQYNGTVAVSTATAIGTNGMAVWTSTYILSLGVGTGGSGVSGEIRATNEITAYYSDRRLKENVQVIDNALVKVLSLHGITYTPNEIAESYGYDRTKKLVGVFADEIEAVLPEAVRPAPFDADEHGNSKSGENYRTVQYEKIVPLLIEAIKEQQTAITALKQELEELKNSIK